MEPQWFFPIFVAGWFLMTGLLAHVGGWARLAEQFRAEAAPSGERFRFLSGSMGNRFFPVNYGGCLFLTVAREGLYLSVLFLFRFQSPPLFIPWHSVESITEERRFFTRYTIITVRDVWPRIALRGQVGDRVKAAYEQVKPPSPTG